MYISSARIADDGNCSKVARKFFADGFVVYVAEFHANSLNKWIRAYLSKYFNALGEIINYKFDLPIPGNIL